MTIARPFQHWAEDFDDTWPTHGDSITAACMRLNVTPTLLLKALRRREPPMTDQRPIVHTLGVE